MGDPNQLGGMFLDQIPICGWILDRDYRFRSVWGQARLVFQRPTEELRGLRLEEVLEEDAARIWTARVDRALAGETFSLREKTLEAVYGATHFPLRSAEGQVRYAAGLAQDLTAFSVAEKELRLTALRILKTQEADRRRLSRFLHDDVGQCLSGAGLQLDLLRMDLETIVPAISSRTAEIQQLLEEVMARVREFSYELNPAVVERAGLGAALDRLVGRSRRDFSGTLRFMADSSLHFPPATGAALYRIAQEALENAIQHSGCSLIELILKSTKSGPALEVRDNGKGFDAAEVNDANRGLGLLVMEHYAAQAQLQLSVVSERGKGTVVRAVYGPPANVKD